ncbi:MAG: energy transducer TonB, partial [Pseudolabrys sp.]
PNAPVILVDLAPVAVAPNTTPTDVPPDVVQSAEAQPEPEPVPEKPIEKIDIPPEPVPTPDLAVLPPLKPVEKPKEKKQKHASIARAAATAEQKAERAAAPMAGASSHNPNALPNWKSKLVSRLERAKRYPPEAQSRGEHGVAQLAFSIDRNGGVHNARIVRSSGSSLLDEATLALVGRAAPLPPPPPEIGGAQIAISVPIRYNVR